jgi:hypothetical protein
VRLDIARHHRVGYGDRESGGDDSWLTAWLTDCGDTRRSRAWRNRAWRHRAWLTQRGCAGRSSD